jgi:DNA processing protein
VPDDAPRARGWPGGFAAGPPNRRAILILASLLGIRPIELHALAWREGTAEACLARVLEGSAGSPADREFAARLDAEAVEAGARTAGARLVTPGSDEYPSSLEDLADPPIVLFVRGKDLDPAQVRVAVVGSRSASPLGRDVARDLGRGLALAGACVVSGAARGIDFASHLGSLDVDGSTIAVLGSGIDVSYPATSRDLIERIATTGSVVSEYPPGVQAEPHRFPARNRIVVGLSRALVVVEGAERSGSMISVTHALSIGREVFAVPGPVTSPLSQVPHRLIREGATMIRGARDLLLDLGYDDEALEAGAVSTLSEADRALLAVLAGPLLPEAVAAERGIAVHEAVAVLMRLELKGLVRSVGGRYEPTTAAGRALDSADREATG